MSEEDRRKWNERYAQGAYAARSTPSEWLVRWLAQAPLGHALDIACGLGRNARYMAGAGFTVAAVDISATAIQKAQQLAQREGVEVRWIEADLDQGLPTDLPAVAHGYQVITLFRYVNAELLAGLSAHLAPGGLLLVEEHLRSSEPVAGPQNPAFRVASGELRQAAAGMQVLAAEEALTADPDGARVAIARIAARRPLLR